MMTKRFIWALLLLSSFSVPASAQVGSWADTLSTALPSVTQMAPTYQSMPGWPSSNLPYTPQDWRLGVNIQNSEVGAVVTQVAPNSAAVNAGIKQGDVIVSAGASRLGVFDNRINDLADEIRRSTSPSGQLNLVVWDSLSRTLRNVNANMQTNTTNSSVQIALRDGASVPVGSTLYVTLRNVTNPTYDMPGSTQSIAVSGYGPYKVNFNLDPRYIINGHTYELNAYIGNYNQYLYYLTRPIQLSSAEVNAARGVTLDRWGTAGTGQNVSVGYPNVNNTQQIREVFQLYLGREPSNGELIGWQGHDLNSLRVGLLTSPQFRDRFNGDDNRYLTAMFQALKNRAPTPQELQNLVNRLYTLNSPSTVAQEIIKSYQ